MWNESEHPRDEEGKFTEKENRSFKSFSKPGVDFYNKRITELQEKSKGLSFFSSERQKYAKEISDLRQKIMDLNSKKEIEQRQPTIQEEQNKNVTSQKIKQFEIIQKYNPMTDDYHTGIRKPSDIKSPEEAFDINDDENYLYPDFTRKDGEKALETGKVVVYSSKPINQGGFVTPSKMMAQDYTGSGQVYSQEVNINDVAWIDGNEGQYAKI